MPSPLRSAAVIAALCVVAASAVAAEEDDECPETINGDVEGELVEGGLVESTEANTFTIVGTTVVFVGRSVSGYYRLTSGEIVLIHCGLYEPEAL